MKVSLVILLLLVFPVLLRLPPVLKKSADVYKKEGRKEGLYFLIRRLKGLPEDAVTGILIKTGIFGSLPEDRMTKEEAQKCLKRRRSLASLAWLLALQGTLICFGTSLEEGKKDSVQTLTRPAFGETSDVSLKVTGLEDTDEIEIEILSGEPTEEEIEEAFYKTSESLPDLILSGNDSLDHVTSSLYFPEETEEGISLSFKSGDEAVLSDHGYIVSSAVPEEGIEVKLTVTMSYGEYISERVFSVTIFPETEDLSEKERLERAIESADAEGRDEETLELPAQFEGKSVSFYRTGTSPYLWLFIFSAGAVLMIFLPGAKEKEEMKKREEALVSLYPAFVSKLGTLIASGLSIRSAFVRITKDFAARPSDRSLVLYTELRRTLSDMDQGVTEGDAYVSFGKRTGRKEYRRLGVLLKTNLRQGVSGLSSVLKNEAEEALQEKRNRARVLGEQAEMKLLIPMMIMLVLVMVLLMVPAFLSF